MNGLNAFRHMIKNQPCFLIDCIKVYFFFVIMAGMIFWVSINFLMDTYQIPWHLSLPQAIIAGIMYWHIVFIAHATDGVMFQAKFIELQNIDIANKSGRDLFDSIEREYIISAYPAFFVVK